MANTKYQSDSGTIHSMRLSQAKLSVAGTPPTGDINSPLRATVSRKSRSYGLRPRGIVISRVVTSGTISKTFTAFLPQLTPTAFNDEDAQLGAEVAYKGNNWIVTAKVAEATR